ncbi:MAG: DUF4838 domain-containing protein [Anaerolineae bacterium]
MPLTIRPIGDAQPVQFAAEELADYIARITASQPCTIKPAKAYDPGQANALWLGTFDALRASGAGSSWPTVDDPEMDDAVAIDVQAGTGTIAGSNPRSVLLAAYRFLTACGCRWVRPGAEGEMIPERPLAALSASLIEVPSYHHRGICIEGAVSYENVADMIDWAPKVGMNAYFFQFRESYTFFERWYTHRGNPTLEPEPFTVERARAYLRRAEDEIAKRGLLYHAVGHGWTCEPLGIPGLSWDAKTYELSDETRQLLAQVNGVREIWQGIPLNTNLCYGNPKVRRLIVEDIADYLEAHPNVDLLHFWLADGSNNQCECPLCEGTRPSDFYVMMLNELDHLLTQRGIDSKVVFLIYVDLLWPPEHEQIQNPDRFVLMFAPITRSYSVPFAADHVPHQLPPFHRNQLTFPKDVGENVAFLRAWQRAFSGDSFDFDYHFMWDHYLDPGYHHLTHTLWADIRNLHEIGLNGLVSCQVQRAFFPNGLGMAVMARTLWDDTTPLEEITADYFAHAYGEDGAAAEAYLAAMSELFDPPYLRGERPGDDEKTANRLDRVPDLAGSFMPTIERNRQHPDPAVRANWRYLAYHANYAKLLARALASRARGHHQAAEAHWSEFAAYLQQIEPAVQPALDVFECLQTLQRRLFRNT